MNDYVVSQSQDFRVIFLPKNSGKANKMEEDNNIGILSLPDEIVLMILKYTSYADCNNFRRTCKRFNELLKSSQSLWKVIYKKTVGSRVYNITALQTDGDWNGDMKKYFELKKTLLKMIVESSQKHFGDASNDMRLIDTQEYFDIALSKTSNNYYITVSILQDFIKTAISKVNTFRTEIPYTLTEIHYAKQVVRYLIHTLLCVKWVQHHINNQLQPNIALNFFIQWLDPGEMHQDEDVSEMINDLIKEVDILLLSTGQTKMSGRLPGVDTHLTCPNEVYCEREVLMAISDVMYKRRRMVTTPTPNMDTLNIIKTIKSRSGHALTLGTIYQTIARSFGMTTCNLIAFPNHLYLEWRYTGPRREKYLIDLDNGAMRVSGNCPFSGSPQNNYQYSPDTFIQYAITTFLRNMRDYRNWNTENASRLLDFVTNHRNSEYCDFLSWIRACICNQGISVPFKVENVPHEYLDMARNLLLLNKPPQTAKRNLTVKTRARNQVFFGVGMICYHRKHDFVCVVQDWNFECPEEMRHRTEAADLEYGLRQPFYSVVAIDQNLRYVAQENLIYLPRPSRLYHLEDMIAKDFTHFNGFFYEPNAKKQLLYPEDFAIARMYSARRCPDERRVYL